MYLNIGSFVNSSKNGTGIVIENLLYCAVKNNSRYCYVVRFFNGRLDYFNSIGKNYSNSDTIRKNYLT